MTIQSKRAVRRVYHFDSAVGTNDFTAVVGGTGTVDLSSTNGALFNLTSLNDNAWAAMAGNLFFPIDKILSIEFLAKISGWAQNTRAYLGMSTALVQADPEAMTQFALFKFSGDNSTASIFNIDVITDDNVKVSKINTGYRMDNTSWKRLRMDFRTGIQSISPPGRSVGGKGSIQVSITDSSLGYQRPVSTNAQTSHLDMSAYSGNLQIVFGVLQTTGTVVGPALSVREIALEYEQLT